MAQNETRRKFIKTTGGVLVAASAAPITSFATTPHVGGSDTIRIGLIGCGGRGTDAAIQAMNTKSGPVQVTAMADVFQARMNKSHKGLMNRHKDKVLVPKEKQFIGMDAYKKVLDSGIDMVILTTPPGFRPMHFEAAVEAGKHVFMEKPVAVDAPGVRRVLAASKKAKEKGLAVAVGLQRRHEPWYQEMMDYLKDGAIGDINFTRANWNGQGVWVYPREEGQTELEHQMKNWYYFNWLCGDHIVEQHIHNLDVINWLKDAYPVKARGMGGREVRVAKEYGQIFDHFAVEFHYKDGSVMLSQCRHIGNTWRDVNEYAHGSKGQANFRRREIRLNDGKVIKVKRAKGVPGGHQQEHHDLFKDLRNGKIPNEGEYGALSTMTAIFGRMATYSGKEISWDQALNSKLTHCEVEKLKDFNSAPPIKPNMDGEYEVPVPGKSWDTVL